MLNRVGVKTQPCFTPLAIRKGLERSLFNLTWPCWSSCSWRNFGDSRGAPMISQRSFLLTVSNALVRSTNVTYSPLFCSRHFSWSCFCWMAFAFAGWHTVGSPEPAPLKMDFAFYSVRLSSHPPHHSPKGDVSKNLSKNLKFLNFSSLSFVESI